MHSFATKESARTSQQCPVGTRRVFRFLFEVQRMALDSHFPFGKNTPKKVKQLYHILFLSAFTQGDFVALVRVEFAGTGPAGIGAKLKLELKVGGEGEVGVGDELELKLELELNLEAAARPRAKAT